MVLSSLFYSENLSIILSGAGLIVSIIVLFITYQTWILKKGCKVRATYGVTSSIYAGGSYISQVIIENLKDRDLIIYDIYVRFGKNIFIDLLNIDDNYDRYHHIIPPLSTRIFQLGAPICYELGVAEVNMGDFLMKNYNNGDIILLTNQGKIKAKKIKRGWSPVMQSFKNYGTYNIRPIRYYHKESEPFTKTQTENYINYDSIEKTTLYIVNLKLKDGRIIEGKIFPKGQVIIFQKLNFTEDILRSVETLKDYLLESRENNLIEFEEIISIIDFQKVIPQIKNGQLGKTINDRDIKKQNFIQYHIISQIETWMYKLKNPNYPSRLYSLYRFFGFNKNRGKKKK